MSTLQEVEKDVCAASVGVCVCHDEKPLCCFIFFKSVVWRIK